MFVGISLKKALGRAMVVRLGLLGNAIEYSLSPQLHTLMWETQKRKSTDDLFLNDFEYLVLDTQNNFTEELDHFWGLQVTQPWKGFASSLVSTSCAENHPENIFGNTLVRGSKGWQVRDTDIHGMYAAMLPKYPDLFLASSVVVFGFGSLAKNFLISCSQKFRNLRQLYVVSRDPSSVNDWARSRDINTIKPLAWDSSEAMNIECDLALQLSSAPHQGKKMTEFKSVFVRSKLVFDACYAPHIPYGLAHPDNFVGGSEMLVEQAIQAWKQWSLPVDELDRDQILNAMKVAT